MPNQDLEDVIVSSLEDSTFPEEPIVDDPSEVSDPDPTPDPPPTAPEATTAPVETSEVSSPAARTQAPKAEPDEFEKKYGIAQNAASGRENRIPYSRVTKIVGKAVNEKVKELEATYTPKITEYETKVKAYEERLTEVGKFEQVMMNDEEKFISMLRTIPRYETYFNKLTQATATPPTKEEVAAVDPSAEMPGPDQKLSDGSSVYSMDGLKALLAWQQAQVEAKVTKQVSERYAPIEKQWKTYEEQVKAQAQIDALIPKIKAQIEEARTWDKFTENEEEITKVLNSNPSISLDRAYNMVVLPKLRADRNAMREEILREIKKAPHSTTSPTSSVKPGPQSSGPKSLEDIIAEQVAGIKG